MDITLKNNELIEAVTEYILNTGINAIDKDIEVIFVAGRGVNGNSAIVSINDNIGTKTTEIPTEPIKRGKGRGRPKGSNNKAKESEIPNVPVKSVDALAVENDADLPSEKDEINTPPLTSNLFGPDTVSDEDIPDNNPIFAS